MYIPDIYIYTVSDIFERPNFSWKGGMQRLRNLILSMGYPGSENVRLGFHFIDLIFVVFQSTAKIGFLVCLELAKPPSRDCPTSQSESGREIATNEARTVTDIGDAVWR